MRYRTAPHPELLNLKELPSIRNLIIVNCVINYLDKTLSKKAVTNFSLIIFLIFLSIPSFTILFAGGYGFLQDIFIKNDFTIFNQFTLYFGNTLKILIPTLFFCLIFGTGSAWFITYFNFPFKRIFFILLFLPLAIPPYIMAYNYGYIFEDYNQIAIFLKSYNITINISHPIIAGLILSFSLFPYIFAISLISLGKNKNKILLGKIYGHKMLGLFFRLALPIIKPSLILGSLIITMEVFAEFGAMYYFGIDTFAVGVYKLWLANIDGLYALKLLFLLITILLIIVFWEKKIKTKLKDYSNKNEFDNKSLPLININKAQTCLIFLFCAIITFFSFILPIINIIYLSFDVFLSDQYFNYSKLLTTTFNSLKLSIIAAFFIMLISFFLVFIKNFFAINKLTNSLISFSFIGYALPSAMIALAIIYFIQIFSAHTNYQLVFLLSSMSVLIYAYICRFLAVGYNNTASNFITINKNLILTSKIYKGGHLLQILKRIFLPLSSKSAILVFLLSFIEVIKELPLTLIIRPFNFETLAVYSYELAKDERIEMAAIPALIIICLVFIMLVLKSFLLKKL